MEFRVREKISPAPVKKSGFYYGYVIVIVTFIVLWLGYGIFYSYGVFFNPLREEFGWTRTVTSGAYSIAVFISGFIGILSGRLSDRLGPKIVIILCAVSTSLGYMLMYLVHSTWQFYLSYAVFISAGMGGFWAPPVSTVARWFIARRGLMTGIVSSGISFGTVVTPPVITNLIMAFGWRFSYLIIGIVILVVVVIIAQFIRSSPQQMGLLPYGERKTTRTGGKPAGGLSLKESVRTRQFWLVCLIYACSGVALLTILVHIVPDAIGLGISEISAATVLSVIGGVSLVGRIATGWIADRLGLKVSTILCLGLFTVSLVWLQFADNLWKLYLFAIFFGFGYGGVSCLQSLIAAEMFGVAALGVITAFFSFSYCTGGALGPVLAGFIFDVSDSYRWAFLFCLVMVIIALVISVSLTPARRKEANDS